VRDAVLIITRMRYRVHTVSRYSICSILQEESLHYAVLIKEMKSARGAFLNELFFHAQQSLL